MTGRHAVRVKDSTHDLGNRNRLRAYAFTTAQAAHEAGPRDTQSHHS
jgi:hypothetical protein